MTELNNGTRELSVEELHLVSGGDINLGPIHIGYSQGSGCIDVGIGNVGVWFGRAGAGWYAGDRSGHL
jgi:hypothetical protein